MSLLWYILKQLFQMPIEHISFYIILFEAKKVDEELAENLSSIGLFKAINAQLGNVIIQFIDPSSDEIETIWFKFLKEKEPGVHNLPF